MESNVVFSLSLKGRETKNVNILIEGFDPTAMKEARYYLQKDLKMYEKSIPLSANCVYPATLSYNYAVDGVLLYPSNQKLIIAKKPLTNRIVINDDEIMKPEDDRILIVFAVIPKIAHNWQNLCLVSDSPVFNDPQKRCLQMLKGGDNTWFGYGHVSIFLNQPIMYQYIIRNQAGHEVARESGRPHVLFIDSPVSFKRITIYDVWNDTIPMLAFYPHVVKPYQTSINATTVTIEYSSPNLRNSNSDNDNNINNNYSSQPNTKNVFIHGSNSTFNKPEQLFPDDCFRREIQIPTEDVACQFEIGISNYQTNENNGNNRHIIKWEKNPNFQIHPNRQPPNAVASRLIFGPTFNRLFGVYVPLVSMRDNPDQMVGDFSTLVSLARWCKQSGICCLHVHVERLPHGLLDPVHANGLHWPNDNNNNSDNDNENTNDENNVDSIHSSLLLPSIRDAKLKSLYNMFQDWTPKKETDKAYQLFVESNQFIIEHCENDFAKWVQYTLFRQLYDAFEEIVDIGVQLITDIVIFGNAQDLEKEVEIASHFSHGIKINGLGATFEQLSVPFVQSLFGSLSDFVLRTFFSVTQWSIRLLENAFSPPLMQNFISQLSPEVRNDFTKKMEIVKKLASRPNEMSECYQKLPNLASNTAATIFIDSQMTNLSNPHNISSLNLVPCSSTPSKNIPQALVPSFLSPEMVSEFPDDVEAKDILGHLVQRINSTEKYVEIYFVDVLRAFGNEATVEPIQLIEGHCRYLLPFTTGDLMSDSGLNRKIRELLNSAQRSV